MGNLKYSEITMKPFMLSLLAVVIAAARKDKETDEVIIKEEELCVCCPPTSEMDNNLRMLCLPPPEEDLDSCIARLEADSNANAASVNDLKVIREEQDAREAEHDHSHEAESAAFSNFSGLAALATV